MCGGLLPWRRSHQAIRPSWATCRYHRARCIALALLPVLTIDWCCRQDSLEESQKRAKKQARELQDLVEELDSAQNQLRDINGQCSDASVELQLFMSAASERKLGREARHNAVDEQAPINRALTQVIDRHVGRLKHEMAMGRLDPDGDGEIDEIPFDEPYVTVMFPHVGEEVVVRTTKSHTFEMLMDDACRHAALPHCPFPKVVPNA